MTAKITEKVNSHCFKLRRSYSISFNLSNVAKFSAVKSERTVSKVRKRKRQFLRCAGLLHIKVGREIGKFHIAKKRDAHVQLLFF